MFPDSTNIVTSRQIRNFHSCPHATGPSIAGDGDRPRIGRSTLAGRRGRPVRAFQTEFSARPPVEAPLPEADVRYRALFDQSPDGVLLIDAETQRIIEFNEAACRQLGYTREEFMGLRISDYEASENPEEIRAHVQAALREGKTEFDTVQRTKTSEIRHVHVWAKIFDLDGRVVFHAIFRDITAQEQMAEALRKSEQRLVYALDATTDGVWDWNIKTGEVIFSTQWIASLGYSPDEVPATVDFWKNLMHPDDWPRVMEALQAHFAGRTPVYQCENRLRLKSGEYRHSLDRGKVVEWDEDGSPARMVGADTDITERKQAEQALRRSHDLLDQTGRLAEVGGWELDLDTQTLCWTNEVYRIHEVGPAFRPAIAEAIQFYAPEVRPVITAAVQAAIDAGTPFDLELPLVTERGRRIWVRAQGIAESRGGKPRRLYGAFQDITGRRLADETRRLQSAALAATPNAVVITDRTGTIEWVNAAFTQLTGYTADEALGKNPRDLVKSGKHNQAFYKDFWDTLLAGRVWRGEMINRRKDGSLNTEDQVVTPILDVSGAITHFVAIKEDISERQQLEAQYRQAQKMESVGQLASGIAHDFNNLLTVIIGMSDLVLEKVRKDDPVHADVQEIYRAGERAAALTRQLLAFSRGQILKPEVMSVNTVVAGMESLLRRLLGEDIDLVIVPAPDPGHIKADPGQIEQVITNLAVNARDAMPRGGRLTIETQNVTIDEDDAHQPGVAMPPGAYVLLVVSDSGIGMDEATRARIFEPFFTTKGPGKGTGLGLSTVHGIVKQNHGFTRIDSEVGQGTSFKIHLPQVTEAASTDRPQSTVASRPGTETILLVEDNAGLRKLITRFLEHAGYTVLGAATGEEALRLLERQEAPVHLLLTDVIMPGMNGRDLAQRLAQTRPELKVLYISGHTGDTIVGHGVLDAGMSFLNKPFTAAVLVRQVRKVLDL